MDILTANTPEKLYEAIRQFLQSDYSQDELVKTYNDARKQANSIRVIYTALPDVPAYINDALDGLQSIRKWCEQADRIVDEIPYSLGQQTINNVISQLKKLRGFAHRIHSLVKSEQKAKIQSEAIAKIEKEREALREKRSKLQPDLSPSVIGADLVLEAQVELDMVDIKAREIKRAVQLYLSEDPNFNETLSQIDSEILKVFEEINKLTGNNSTYGKVIDIYCKLKDIPLQQQYSEVSYSFRDLGNIIFDNCNRLYISIDDVINTLEDIKTKAQQKPDATKPTSGKAGAPNEKPAEIKQNTTPAKVINIEKFKGVLGDVQAENVQTGDYASIHKHSVTTEKKKGIFRRIPYWIYILICLFAAMITILEWEPIKAFFTKVLWPK